MKTIYTMSKIYSLLNKEVSSLNCLGSLDGMNGFFLYYSEVISNEEKIADSSLKAYRDIYCYEYKRKENHIYFVKFYTRLYNNKIMIEKIEII